MVLGWGLVWLSLRRLGLYVLEGVGIGGLGEEAGMVRGTGYRGRGMLIGSLRTPTRQEIQYSIAFAFR